MSTCPSRELTKQALTVLTYVGCLNLLVGKITSDRICGISNQVLLYWSAKCYIAANVANSNIDNKPSLSTNVQVYIVITLVVIYSAVTFE